MKSLLNQLENDEAILLMYVADELPPQDRAAIERRLSSDASLRAQLDSLRTSQETAFGFIREFDSQRLPAGQGAGSRRVIRAMQRWQAGREIERAAQIKPRGFRIRVPAWAYPMAAAAVLIVGFVLWGMNVEKKHITDTSNSTAWTGDPGFPPFVEERTPPDVSPVAEQYAKLEETLDDSANLTAVDDQVSSLSDWGSPILPKDVVEQ